MWGVVFIRWMSDWQVRKSCDGVRERRKRQKQRKNCLCDGVGDDFDFTFLLGAVCEAWEDVFCVEPVEGLD